MAVPVGPLCNSVRAYDDPGMGSPSVPDPNDDGLILDPETLRVIDLVNMELYHNPEPSLNPLGIGTSAIDESQRCSFALYVNSVDGESSVLLVGGIDANGIQWMHSVQYSIDQALELMDLVNDPEAFWSAFLPVSTSRFASSGFWDGFWEGYWHYLTNPRDMDTDLEYAFYGAVGTAVVAGTAAGGVAVWGAMGGGQFAVGISAGSGTWIPHITHGFGARGVYTWAHGVGAAGFTTTYGAGAGTTITITGIPILAPGAVAGWVATRPDVGNCLVSCIVAFFRGLWPF